MEEVNIFNERGSRMSWGSIIAGVVTVLAVSVLLSLIGTSIGLFMLDPTDSEPFSGVGTSMGIWTVISLLVSLAAGGFVAGKLAARDGIIHGFLTWAASLIVAVILGAMLVSSAVKVTGNVLGSVSAVTGDILSGFGSVISDASSEVAPMFGNIDVKQKGDKVSQDVQRKLRETGVKELQPNYIQKQIQGARTDLKKSLKNMAANPKQADEIMDGFTDRLQARINNYASNIDREKLVKAVENSGNVSRAQAESTVDQYMTLIEDGRNSLDDLQEEIKEARAEWEQTKQEALEKSEKMANSAAWASIWSFIGLLLGAVVACLMGRMGVRKSKWGYDV